MKRTVLLWVTLVLGAGLSAFGQTPIILTVNQPDPLMVDAGANVEIGMGESVMIGGNPSAENGYGDYLYSWTPIEGLSDATIANPVANPEITTTYMLTVTDANNCTSTSEITVSVGTSGIEELSNNLQISCYPNPVQDELMLEMKGLPLSVSIRVFNTMGTELLYKTRMMSGGEDIERIPMHSFPAGVYYLQIVSEDKTFYQSILKTR